MKRVSNNVVQFPRGNAIQHIATDPESVQNLTLLKINHIGETLSFIIPQIFKSIELAGFDILPETQEEEDEYMKDNLMLVEAIRSLLSKYYDVDHPLQEVSEKMFIRKEDGTVSITSNLNIKFDPEKFTL